MIELNYYEELAKKALMTEEERKEEIASELTFIKDKRKLLEVVARNKNLILLRSEIERKNVLVG